jgi:hypothetical protein
MLGGTMPHDRSHKLTPSELAEAEATRDVIDVDGDDTGLMARRAAEMPTRPSATDTELAQADCDSDLTHAEPTR